MKARLLCYLLLGTAALIVGPFLMAQPPAAPAAKPTTEDLVKAVQKQADEIAALKQQLAAQNPAPMPAGGGAQPVKVPAGPKGRGYVPPTPATRARLHAAAKAMHGDRLGALAKFQALPAAFDCRAKGWSLPVGDQGACGSCYLCSTGITASAAFVKAGYGKPDGSLSISWQYGMDCHDFGGCNGGNGTEVIDWMVKNGFPAESYVDVSGTVHHDYPPYEARERTCRKVAGAKYWKPASWGFCTADQGDRQPTVTEIKTAMFNYGTLNIALDAGGQFGNGTETITSLGNNIDHEINCVAWDDAKDGGAFLLQNQWSEDWGVRGFRWVTYKAATHIVDWFWVTADPLPPPPPPATVAVPNVVGKTLKNAQAAIVGAGLNYAGPPVDAVTLVVSQVPPAGTQVAAGSAVTVTGGVTPPNPPGVVTLTLTPEQVQLVIDQSGAMVITGDTTIQQVLDAIHKAKFKAGPKPLVP